MSDANCPATGRESASVIIELDANPPITESEIAIVEAFFGDLLAELLSEIPEDVN